MKPGEIQGDAAFMRFQEKLALVVANARAAGKRIAPLFGVPDCCCPLGAHPDSITSQPSAQNAHKHGWGEVHVQDLRAFIEGVAGSRMDPGPYADLGRAYREMFP